MFITLHSFVLSLNVPLNGYEPVVLNQVLCRCVSFLWSVSGVTNSGTFAFMLSARSRSCSACLFHWSICTYLYTVRQWTGTFFYLYFCPFVVSSVISCPHQISCSKLFRVGMFIVVFLLHFFVFIVSFGRYSVELDQYGYVVYILFRSSIAGDFMVVDWGVLRYVRRKFESFWFTSFWPGINENIEQTFQQCDECQKHHREEPAAPLHPLEVTTGPWQWVHIHFVGPFQGRMWLVLMDSYSKWPEVVPMQSIQQPNKQSKLRPIFVKSNEIHHV